MTIDLSKLPTPAEKNISVRVKAAAERAVRQGHPWVFEDAIVKQSHLGNAGDLAVIYDREKNQFLAVGLVRPAVANADQDFTGSAAAAHQSRLVY